MFNNSAYIDAQKINIKKIEGIICMDYHKKEFVDPLFSGNITYLDIKGNITEIRYYKNGKKISSILFR